MSEILDFKSNNSKSVDVKSVPETPITEFHIKGQTLEVLLTDLSTDASFSSENGRWTRDGQILTYTPKVGDSTNNSHPLRLKSTSTLQFDTTYTLCYKVHYSDPTMIKMTKWTQGDGHKVLPVQEGVHSLTFTTSVFSETWFLYTNLLKSVTEEKIMLVVEILGIVVGEKAVTSHPGSIGLVSIGIEGKGVEIVTQTQKPILGEYKIQGDIPEYIENIENKIVKNKDTFNVSWI